MADDLTQLSDVALDTSVLCRPYDRRFLMASWEIMGDRVPVLPRVVRELFGTMADNEGEHWARRVLPHEESRGWEYSNEERFHIIEAVEKGARAWVKDEIDAQFVSPERDFGHCALRAVRMTPEQHGAAHAIGMAIPDYCFKGPTQNNYHGDRMVVGEASVMGYAVLASRNRLSIRRARMNTWLRQHVGLNADLVREADDAVTTLFEDMGCDPDEAALRGVLLACLPDSPVPPRREAEIVHRFIDVLGSSSFPDCAEGALKAWTGPKGVELAKRSRLDIANSAARDTEARRLLAVRSRAQKVGWALGR